MRHVRIGEGMGLSDFAQIERNLRLQQRAQSRAAMANEAASELEYDDGVDGMDDLGKKRKGFFKRLRKLAPHNILKKISPVQMLMHRKRGGGGGGAPAEAGPTAPPPLTDVNGNMIPYVAGQPYPPPGIPLSPESQQAVASGVYAAYSAPSASASYPGAPAPYYPPAPGMTTPTGGGAYSPAPSYGPEPGLPSAYQPPLPTAPAGGGAPAPEEPLPEPPPEDGGEEGGEEGDGERPRKGAVPVPSGEVPKASGDNLPAHVGPTTALIATGTSWVTYALIAGGVVAVGLAVYFFVIKKKKKPE